MSIEDLPAIQALRPLFPKIDKAPSYTMSKIIDCIDSLFSPRFYTRIRNELGIGHDAGLTKEDCTPNDCFYDYLRVLDREHFDSPTTVNQSIEVLDKHKKVGTTHIAADFICEQGMNLVQKHKFAGFMKKPPTVEVMGIYGNSCFNILRKYGHLEIAKEMVIALKRASDPHNLNEKKFIAYITNDIPKSEFPQARHFMTHAAINNVMDAYSAVHNYFSPGQQDKVDKVFFESIKSKFTEDGPTNVRILEEWSRNVYQYMLEHPDALDYQSFTEVFS